MVGDGGVRCKVESSLNSASYASQARVRRVSPTGLVPQSESNTHLQSLSAVLGSVDHTIDEVPSKSGRSANGPFGRKRCQAVGVLPSCKQEVDGGW